MITGKQALLRQMRADGISYIFGNPGTVEQGLLDELQEFPDIEYITCLHESVAAAAADGFARKTKQPGVIQLHSGVGLGNGIGMLYQSLRGHTPLIVIAGEAGIQYDAMNAQMACDLVEMARPVTKYAARAVHPDSVLRLWRRAYKEAMTPPMGPVFLCLPMDILDAANEEEIRASILPDTYVSPSPQKINAIAEALSEARRPMLLIGDGVDEADAAAEIEHCVALLGAPVCGVNTSCINISQTSPYYKGDLGHMFGSNSKKTVQEADVILMVGTYAFPEVFPELKNPYRPDAKIFHIDLNSWEIAKNHPVTLGLWAHPKAAMTMLNARLESMALPGSIARTAALLAPKPAHQYPNPVTASFFQTLQPQITEHTILFDEALTASPDVTAALPRTKPGTFFQTRGGSLGVGIPGGLGIQLACPDESVLVFTGDGGSMYTIQALHTIARYQIPVKIVICNNGRYGLLDDNLAVYRREKGIPSHAQPDCFSLAPAIDFVTLAASFGIRGMKADTPEQAREAALSMISSEDAFLVELCTKTAE